MDRGRKDKAPKSRWYPCAGHRCQATKQRPGVAVEIKEAVVVVVVASAKADAIIIISVISSNDFTASRTSASSAAVGFTASRTLAA